MIVLMMRKNKKIKNVKNVTNKMYYKMPLSLYKALIVYILINKCDNFKKRLIKYRLLVIDKQYDLLMFKSNFRWNKNTD